MAVTIQNIGVGTIAGDGTGDLARTGGQKINQNFSNLKAAADLVLDVPQNYILGRATASTGDTEKLTATQIRTILELEQQSGFIDRADSTLSFVDGTRTFTIAPSASSFQYWQGDTKYTVSASDDIVITDVEGLHFIYYEGSTLTHTTTFTELIITDYAFVAAIYWDATNNVSVILADERHGYQMDSATHLYNHNTFGARYGDGLALGNMNTNGTGNAAGDAQFSVSSGSIWDEDIDFAIIDGSPQTLSTAAELPIFYRSGASGLWRMEVADTFPITTTGTGLAAWNEWTGATYQLTEATSGNYVLYHYYATTDVRWPVVALPGIAEYASLANAQAAAESEIHDLAFGAIEGLTAEMIPIATVIWETKSSFTNAVKSRTRPTSDGDDYIDWRGISGGGVGGGSGGIDLDPDAIHVNIGSEIQPITPKGTPVGADVLVIEDSAATWAKKSITISAIPHDSLSGVQANEHIDWTSATQNLSTSGTIAGSNLSGSNTGDQTSIVGITGTKAEFDTAVTDGNFLYVGDVTSDTGVPAMLSSGGLPVLNTGITAAEYRTAIGAGTSSTTGTVTAVNNGNGMNFTNITSSGTVTLGTPSTCTAATTNAVTASSHTHAITGMVELTGNQTVGGIKTFSDTAVFDTTTAGGPGSGIKIGDFELFPFGSAVGQTDDPTFRSAVTDGGTIFRVMGNGTGTAAFEFFATDFFNDSVNWENVKIQTGTKAVIQTDASGTGVVRPLSIYAGDTNVDQLLLNIDGSTTIGAALTVTGAVSASNLSGTNTGDNPGVTAVNNGNGMNFTNITGSGTVTLGTPSTCTNATTNAVTASSHTHAITGFALTGHTHSSFDRASSVLSGATVFSNIVVTDGITTAIATRELAAADIGALSTSHAGGNSHIDWTTDQGATNIHSGNYTNTTYSQFAGSTAGLVPTSVGGTTNYLRADGAWGQPPGTSSGTVTNVTVGTGLDVTNGTTTPSITLDFSELSETTTWDHTGGTIATEDSLIMWDLSAADERRILLGNIPLSGFNNDSGFTSNTGTVTSVATGTGLDGSFTTSGTITLDLSEVITRTTELTSSDYVVCVDGTTNCKITLSNFGAELDSLIPSIYNTSQRIGYSSTTYVDFNSADFDVVFGSAVDFRFNDGGAFEANGNITAYSGSISSDRNLKKNIIPIENALDKVKTLTGCEFNWKRDDKVGGGLIAQDVQEVMPDAVHTHKDLNTEEEYLTLDYNHVIGLLVQAINELAEKVAA